MQRSVDQISDKLKKREISNKLGSKKCDGIVNLKRRSKAGIPQEKNENEWFKMPEDTKRSVGVRGLALMILRLLPRLSACQCSLSNHSPMGYTIGLLGLHQAPGL